MSEASQDGLIARCIHCDALVDAEQDWCQGCSCYVCGECAEVDVSPDPHAPEDHLADLD